jgi:hypothetical protein
LSLRKEILSTIALSGWWIGLTVVAAGGELLGLARELIHAGAETSVLNLLDVQDQSAAQLMTSFYRHLVCGRTKTDALQQAMQQVRLEYPHPYHWAPFTLAGKGQGKGNNTCRRAWVREPIHVRILSVPDWIRSEMTKFEKEIASSCILPHTGALLLSQRLSRARLSGTVRSMFGPLWRST